MLFVISWGVEGSHSHDHHWMTYCAHVVIIREVFCGESLKFESSLLFFAWSGVLEDLITSVLSERSFGSRAIEPCAIRNINYLLMAETRGGEQQVLFGSRDAAALCPRAAGSKTGQALIFHPNASIGAFRPLPHRPFCHRDRYLRERSRTNPYCLYPATRREQRVQVPVRPLERFPGPHETCQESTFWAHLVHPPAHMRGIV